MSEYKDLMNKGLKKCGYYANIQTNKTKHISNICVLSCLYDKSFLIINYPIPTK